jgi:hypothetical protein
MNKPNYNIFRVLAHIYLQENPERFTKDEMAKFNKHLEEWIVGNSDAIDDDIYDFLIAKELIHKPRRETVFMRYIKNKYSPTTHKNILDVGSGRLCRLGVKLSENGFNPSCIDPNIRLDKNEAQKLHLAKIIKDRFICDDFSKHNKGTNIANYDLLVGLEPCDATEHIIRQGLKYEKPFDIILCYAAHKSLTGKSFQSPEDWYEYLQSISQEIHISKINDSFIATNSK